MANEREASLGHWNDGSTYRDRVDGRAAGGSVVAYYAARYRHTSEAGWRAAILEGRVTRNGAAVSPEAALAAGDRLEFRRPPWREPPAPRAFDILHEDDDLVAVAKPSGLPVLPGGGFLESTLLHLVRASDPSRRGASPVHRLGRGTSGIVLFGRTRAACDALAEEFRRRRAVKLYIAVARGAEMPDRFVARAPIGLVDVPPIGAAHIATPEGKPAETRLRVLARDRGAGRALLLARIVTGRPHQIRIHLAASGFPLEGDPFYVEGGVPRATRPPEPPPRVGDCGYRLHAWAVRLRHPSGRGLLAVRAPLPNGFLGEFESATLSSGPDDGDPQVLGQFC
jgi:23S rRNA pseudouridine1911/1915/1917 synthase